MGYLGSLGGHVEGIWESFGVAWGSLVGYLVATWGQLRVAWKVFGEERCWGECLFVYKVFGFKWECV